MGEKFIKRMKRGNKMKENKGKSNSTRAQKDQLAENRIELRASLNLAIDDMTESVWFARKSQEQTKVGVSKVQEKDKTVVKLVGMAYEKTWKI